MAVPVNFNSYYSYIDLVAVVDVQTIIDSLYDELVTDPTAGNIWTCTVGGKTQTPTTYVSPVRTDGAMMTITLTRSSASRLNILVYDSIGLLVNNQTSNNLDIAASPGNNVQLFTGPFHFCINSARATPECFHCGMADQTPEPFSTPRPIFWASAGPRNNTGTLTNNEFGRIFCLIPAATTYAIGGLGYHICHRGDSVPGSDYHQSIDGTLLTESVELMFAGAQYSAGYWAGRFYQAIMSDSTSLTSGSEVNVPLDGPAVVGIFKVVGCTAWNNLVLAFRKGMV